MTSVSIEFITSQRLRSSSVQVPHPPTVMAFVDVWQCLNTPLWFYSTVTSKCVRRVREQISLPSPSQIKEEGKKSRCLSKGNASVSTTWALGCQAIPGKMGHHSTRAGTQPKPQALLPIGTF